MTRFCQCHAGGVGWLAPRLLVTCPDNLNGAQGATIQCELTDAGQTYGVDVSGTRVDAGNLNFDIKADDQSEQ